MKLTAANSYPAFVEVYGDKGPRIQTDTYFVSFDEAALSKDVQARLVNKRKFRRYLPAWRAAWMVTILRRS